MTSRVAVGVLRPASVDYRPPLIPGQVVWHSDGAPEKQGEQQVVPNAANRVRNDLPSVGQMRDQLWMTAGVVDVLDADGADCGREDVAGQSPQDDLVIGKRHVGSSSDSSDAHTSGSTPTVEQRPSVPPFGDGSGDTA